MKKKVVSVLAAMTLTVSMLAGCGTAAADTAESGTAAETEATEETDAAETEEADAAAHAYIAENYGKEYVAEKVTEKKGKAKIQDAHEAIRPSDITRTPQSVKESLSRDQFRLYQLIWNRFTASRMKEAVYETISVKIGRAGGLEFRFSLPK